MKLYVTVATRIRALIDESVLRPGDKVFSVREASLKYKVSISTVIKAYELLEQEGVIYSHPQSGYYVSQRQPSSRKPHAAAAPARQLTQVELVLSTLRSIRESGTIPLGSPFPDAQLFPVKKIRQYENALNADNGDWGVLNDLPPGNEGLRQQIAKRYLDVGMDVSPRDIVITHGATEAISLCLQAVAKAGEYVDLVSVWQDGITRRADRFLLVEYDIPRGCLGGYYPETNNLVPLESVADISHTPTSKSVPVLMEPHRAAA